MQTEIPTAEIYDLCIIIFIGVCSRCRKRLGKIRREVPAEEVEEVSVRMCAVSLVRCSTYKNHMMLNVRLIFSIMVLFTRRVEGG